MPVEISLALVYLAALLMTAKIGGILAAKIKQPPVFGELLLGIIIGPSVLGLVSHYLGLPIFVDLNSEVGEFVGVFGEIGIILLLFLAGLSLDMNEFKAAGRPATIVATFGAMVAFALGFSIASIVGWSPLQAGFAGAVLAATSVGITVRALLDLNVLHTKVGMVILGAAVIDDVWGIFILSALVGVASEQFSLFGFAETSLLVVIFFIIVFYAGSRLIPKVLSFFSRLPVEEITLSIVLALIFIISALAGEVKLAPITGAFLAGLIMSKTQVADPALKTKISAIGYGLFIPLFFVEMGVRTDLQSLVNVGILGPGLVAVAIFDKIVGCGLGAKVAGLSYRDSLRVGVGMMPRAEVALVIAAIGTKMGIVDVALLSITVLIVIVTSLITPLLIKIAFKGYPRVSYLE